MEYYGLLYQLVIIACAIGGLYLILQVHVYSLVKRDSRSQRVVLCGISNSGKTSLWSRLTSLLPVCDGRTIPSLACVGNSFVPLKRENDGAASLFDGIEVIDTPGEWSRDVELTATLFSYPSSQEKLEGRMVGLQVYGRTNLGKGNLDGFATYTTANRGMPNAIAGRTGSAALNGLIAASDYLSFAAAKLLTKIVPPSVSAFVFCLDSTDIARVKEAASYLFELMCLPQWQQRPPALCILLTKRDVSGARHKNLIRDDLEREIERLIRAARGAVLAANIPHSSNRVSRFVRRMQQRFHLPNVVTRLVPFPSRTASKTQCIFSKTPNTFFRFNNINSPFFQFLAGDNMDENVQLTKAFIQRATIMQR